MGLPLAGFDATLPAHFEVRQLHVHPGDRHRSRNAMAHDLDSFAYRHPVQQCRQMRRRFKIPGRLHNSLREAA